MYLYHSYFRATDTKPRRFAKWKKDKYQRGDLKYEIYNSGMLLEIELFELVQIMSVPELIRGGNRRGGFISE